MANFDGTSGNDVLTGTDGPDMIRGLGGGDTIDAGAGDDTVEGGDGDDTLDGGAGLDRMYGGLGNDSYVVSDRTDYAYENVGEGVDEVFASITHALRDNVENLTLTGTGSIYGSGNALANVITGNSANNRLYGLGGDDRLYGGLGNDQLEGGAGIDRMYGGLGNDVYVVSDATDYAYEFAGEGIDTVYASISHALRADIERLRLTGTADLEGRGNDLANLVSGNSGANMLFGLGGDDRVYGGDGDDQLNGGAGVDRLYGGTGDDTYIVTDSTDFAHERADEGYDRVQSSVSVVLREHVEQLELTGTADINGYGNEGANTLVGNSAANTLSARGGDDQLYGEGGNDQLYGEAGTDALYGGDGDDRIEGGSGADYFTGGAGADQFVFRNGDYGTTFATADSIQDFSAADGDVIRLDVTDADSLVEGDQAFTWLGTGSFTGAAGELRYYQNNGFTFIIGDTDGDGVHDLMIRLNGLHTLESDDFMF